MLSLRPPRRFSRLVLRIVSARWSDSQLLQFIEQPLGLLEVGGVEALGEPAVDRGEKAVRLGAPALLPPKPRKAHRSAQFPELRALFLCHRDGLVKSRFGGFFIGVGEGQQELAP